MMLTETAQLDSWQTFEPSRYVARVAPAIESSSGPELEEVSASWRRSAEHHRVDPQSTVAPRILTAGELRERREPMESQILAAQLELDRLYAIMRQPGYVVLLCDPTGIAVDHRGSDERSAQLRYWGIWSGAVWSVMQERVRKAQQMLARTDLPLATIAAAVGFSDQSHLSRHFRRLAGTTPSGFRRAQR